MKKKRILLIGAGQLGSRHLQALAALHEEAIIEVVDPTRENLEIAKKRFEQISGFEKHYLNLHDSIASLDKTAVNLAIIATNSSVRSEVIKELLNHLQVKFMVLEKFLFQKAKEYSEIGNLLNEKGVVTYVNCTRRLFVDYQKIKNSITGAKVVYMDVVGNEWGLGCNGVHFIDLFQWLSNQDVTKWSADLDDSIIQSKRSGYVDFSGALVGYTSGKSRLTLTCFNQNKPNISIRISTADRRFVVGEGVGKVWEETITEESITLTESDFNMAYQSQLTNLVAEQLFGNGSCDLTPYNESVKSHLPFLEVLLEHFNRNRIEKTIACPIT